MLFQEYNYQRVCNRNIRTAVELRAVLCRFLNCITLRREIMLSYDIEDIVTREVG